MDITTLVNTTSKAWSLTILSLLDTGVAGRQAVLLSASGASRTAFKQSLDHLLDIGFLERNPGHGHPLRPEYRLTSAGMRVAPTATEVLNMVTHSSARELLRRRWTVAVLAALFRPATFSETRKVLAPITDRALSQSLKSLEDYQWVRRTVEPAARPPRTLYGSINAGARISRAIASKFSLD